MTYTKEDRLFVYETMLRIYSCADDEELHALCNELGIQFIFVQVSMGLGMCALLCDFKHMKLDGPHGYLFDSITHFPELWVQKPSDLACYWWKPGLIEPRLEAVKKAIEMLKLNWV